MSLLIAGSIAFDNIKTPFKNVKEVLGGSATYASHAAGFFTKPRLTGVVGRDFPGKYIKDFTKRNIDVRGLKIVDNKTFRWTGEYKYDMNVRETMSVSNDNIFTDFKLCIPGPYRDSTEVFLANIHPSTQLEVLKEIKNPRLVACDTMDRWIKNDLKCLKNVLKRSDILFINDSEARELSGVSNLILAARMINRMGPKIVVLKKGEHGSILMSKDWHFMAPAFPLESVYDPTGAGDSFAGGFMGYISTCKKITETEIKRALIYGTTTASYCVEDFSINRFLTLSRKKINSRFKELIKITHFEQI